VGNNMSNDKQQPNGNARSVVKERPRMTSFCQLRNRQQNDLADASKVSFPRTNSAHGCKGTW